jgi:galactokinase
MVGPPLSYESTAESLRQDFERSYSENPTIFRAPGRVNLIGEHTDYNDGFVMPVAIGFYTWIAANRRDDRILHARSEEFEESLDLALESLGGPPRKHWSDFVRGVAAELKQRGMPLTGANLIIHGQVPMGAGLSSSASLEVAIGLALLSVSHANLEPLELVKACQHAEHKYVGTRCGIMDQFIAVFGRAGHALMLDCRSLDYQTLAIPGDARLVICNSMVKHDLASGEYNRRREACEEAVRIFRQSKPEVRALRDVSMGDLEKQRTTVSDELFRRCRHVITENQRVLDAAEALRSSDLNRFGELMYQSHHSLRDDYEVSCQELDLLVEIASSCEGVYGSRMTGGGFGGCTVTLVRSAAVESFRDKVVSSYKLETGLTPDVYVCSASQGAGSWQESS